MKHRESSKLDRENELLKAKIGELKEMQKAKDLRLIKQEEELEVFFRMQRVMHKRKEAEQRKEEAEILARIQETTALKGVAELATGLVYTESIKTSWTPPRSVLRMPQARHSRAWSRLWSWPAGARWSGTSAAWCSLGALP